jgi:hypothetical protein
MALLNDIRNIIKPINTINYELFNKNLDNILENLIIHNNIIYNSYIFNYIIYNTNNELHSNIITIISKHINNYIKNQRIHFRNLNKKNKLDIKDFNNFFDDCYKLINKLNGMFQHIIKNKSSTSKKNGIHKWGDSILWTILIENINNIILHDVVFKYAVFNNIKNTPSHEKNPDMFKLFNYIKTFFDYYNITHVLINLFDEAVVNTIEMNINDINMNTNINNIYKFKKLHKYFFDYYVNYYYITKDFKLDKITNYITNFIKNIFENNNIAYVKNFITIYKKEFILLMKHINISNILLSFPINDITNYISYNTALYEILKDTKLENVIIECIKIKNLEHFKTYEDVLILANLINTDILNKEINSFYYLLGYYCNKDEFIMAICQKSMERIIYTYSDIYTEHKHTDIFNKTFNNKQYTLKYNTIRDDYNMSIRFWNSVHENQNDCKLIITSLDAWKINHSIGYSDTIINTEHFSTLLCNKIFQYNDVFKNAHVNRKLIIYPHIGWVDIEIYNKKITVLPAHMLCLELFVSFDTHLMYELIFNKLKQSMSNYKDEFIKNIIDSLIGPILIKTKDDSFRIRTDIKDINMVDVFYNNHNLSMIKEIKEELAHSKNEIIMANMNHYIKKYKKIHVDQLYDIVSKNITLFKINRELYMKAFNSLIKSEYAVLVDNNQMAKHFDY